MVNLIVWYNNVQVFKGTLSVMCSVLVFKGVLSYLA